jgi:flavin reductase (DIM6/NTAB) family NADH-FMN oxidoreductase RutF
MNMKNPTYDPKVFRKTLSHFASGVTILTTIYRGSVYGMTANAFCSVSLEPPLVLVSINNHSNMHAFLPQSGWYGISILARNQEALSRHFSGRTQEQVLLPFVWHEGYPLIQGAVSWLTCRVVEAHLAGDHTLYIGRVESLGCSDECAPLVFYCGQYRSLERERESSRRSTDKLSQRDAHQESTLPGFAVNYSLFYEPSWW